MMFLLGRHAMFGHDPPMYLRSIAATRLPSPAKVHAAIVDPVPPPRISRSKSSIFASFDDCTDDVFFEFFIPVSSQELLHSDSKCRIVRPATWYTTASPGGLFSSPAHATFAVSRSAWACIVLTLQTKPNDLPDLQIALKHPLRLVAEPDMKRNTPVGAVAVLR